MYIYNIKLKYYINNLDRINRYTAGINEKKTYINNDVYDKITF